MVLDFPLFVCVFSRKRFIMFILVNFFYFVCVNLHRIKLRLFLELSEIYIFFWLSNFQSVRTKKTWLRDIILAAVSECTPNNNCETSPCTSYFNYVIGPVNKFDKA